MEQLIEFASNHALLVAAFVGVAIALLWSLFGAQLQGIDGLAPLEATLKMNHDEAVVIDVREDSEFKQGHILNAIHIPLGNLQDKLGRLEKYREKPIIASCATGSRSSQACHTLKQQGFAQVYNLRGGIMAWQNANLPLTKSK